MSSPPSAAVSLTLLPNGVAPASALTPGYARVSILLTLSLPENTPLKGSPFENWPLKASILSGMIGSRQGGIYCFTPGLTPGASWQKTRVEVGNYYDAWQTNDESLIGELWEMLTTPDEHYKGEEMWATLMADIENKTSRRPQTDATDKLALWQLSHDAAALHYVHQEHRMTSLSAEVMHHHSGSENRGDLDATIDTLNAQQSRVNVYLHPFRQPDPSNGSNPEATMEVLLSRRSAALNFVRSEAAENTSYSAEFRGHLGKRVTHALQLLENSEEKLLDIGVYAVQLSCVWSLAQNYPEDTKKASTTIINKALTDPGAIKPEALDQAQRYIEFLLFARRSKRSKANATGSSDLTAPDFHQLLGLLYRFPGVLRKLGLVIDVDLAAVPPNTICISFDTSKFSPDLLTDISFTSLFTNCTTVMDGGKLVDFYATPQTGGVSLIYKRFLALGATDDQNHPTFSLISQDAEGDTHKRLLSSVADSRGVEYLSKADAPPTIGTRQTPDLGLNQLPAARTSGLTLLHSDRLARLQAALNRTKDPSLGQQSNPFYADDLVLGYRVDLRSKDMSSHWYPLGARKGKYRMLSANGKPNGKSWEPQTELEKFADEGFISPASTSTTPEGGEQQIQVHQALFTWSGWGIGFPTLFEPMNGNKSSEDDLNGKNPHLRMVPVYTPAGRLLPLRFFRTYDARCRIVDLAGNSVQPGDTALEDEPRFVISHKLSRHEPVRSPHVLLTEPLHRASDPGAQGDRLVVRDHSGETTRAVVPPREPLRMAELQGILRNAEVPRSAFPGITLEKNGSFPQADRSAKSAEGRDAIFTADREALAPDLPYYPDPLARFLRISVLSHSLPPTAKIDPLIATIKDPLTFYPSGEWPLCWPCRIRLQAGKPGSNISAEVRDVELDDNVHTGRSVKGLVVVLPPASIVTLNLSSAAIDSNENPCAAFRTESTNKLRTAPGKLGALDQRFLFQVPVQPHVVAAHASAQVRQSHGLVAPLAVRSQELESPPPLALVASVRQSSPAPAVHIDSMIRDFAAYLHQTCDAADGGLYDGNYPSRTPYHTVTLIHAVKKPLVDATPVGGDTLTMVRNFGETVAHLQNSVGPDEIWLGAAKISCHAQWTDNIDNLKNPGPTDVNSQELVFELSSVEHDALVKAQPQPGKLPPSLIHHLRDTRAHKITYRLSATSRFRDYYSPTTAESEFTRESPPLKEAWVDSSSRPPAPVLSYLIPSFKWREDDEPKCKGTLRQRVSAIRVYHQRPWNVSGDCEQLGIVLETAATTTDKDTLASPYVSCVAMDPVWQSAPTQSLPKKLKQEQFIVENVVPNCYLAETDALVDVAVFDMKYATERQLWYCDIPFNLCKQYFPFVRLALVRYQQHALWNRTQLGEARISPVVFADFAQIAPNRYVAVQVSGKSVTLTISGDAYYRRSGAYGTGVTFDNQISVEVQTRWHHLPFDLGWRPTGKKVPPPTPTVADGICTWTCTIPLDGNPSLFKYRLLIEETETLYQDDPSIRTPTDKPRAASDMAKAKKEGKRTTYFDFMEL
jgi:hypothetical protein